MKTKYYKNTLILLAFLGMTASSQAANAHEFFWQAWSSDYSHHLEHNGRDLQNHHPFQWKGANEGEHDNVININKLLQNGQDLKIIKRITFADRAGYVEVTDLFSKLAYRDQLVFANALDGLLKARKKADYDVFYIRAPNNDILGSYSKHGLDIY